MSDSHLDLRTLAYIQTLFQAASMTDDWKSGLDKLLIALRTEFVFDNVAIYEVDPTALSLEVIYARAVGRGKAAEADAAWGAASTASTAATAATIPTMSWRIGPTG